MENQLQKYDPSLPEKRQPKKASIQEVMDRWFEPLSERTKKTYKECFESYAKYKKMPLSGALKWLCESEKFEGLGDIADYGKSMNGLKPRTINLRFAALRSFTTAAEYFGLMSWSLKVKSLKTGKPDRRGPGLDGVDKIMEQARQNPRPEKAARDCAIIGLLFHMALRCFEVYDLDLNHLDPEEAELYVLRKGEREREILPVPTIVMKLLMDWIEYRGTESGPLFTSFDRSSKRKKDGRISYSCIRDNLIKLGLDANIKRRVRAHGLRHTLATQGLNEFNGDSRKVMKVTGHDSPKTLHGFYDDERDEKRAAFEELSQAWLRFKAAKKKKDGENCENVQ